MFLLSVVGPVAPGLPSEVAAEEAPHLFSSRISAVEKSSRGEVVRLLVDFELFVRRRLTVIESSQGELPEEWMQIEDQLERWVVEELGGTYWPL